MSLSMLPQALVRALFFAVVCIGAVFLGWMLSNPASFGAVAMMGLVVGVLLLPLALQHHWWFVVLAWNSVFVVFFLPGSPPLWMAMVGLSALVLFLQNALSRQRQKLQTDSGIAAALLVLAAIVVVTSVYRGGLGVRALGSEEYGGRPVIFILASILGFFILSVKRLEPELVPKAVALFFLSGLTLTIPNILTSISDRFLPLVFLFRAEYASFALGAATSRLSADFTRLEGLAWGSVYVVLFLLTLYGLRGCLTLRHPGRSALFILALGGTMSGGHRSLLVLMSLLIVTLFFLEGLHRTHVIVYAGATGALALAFLFFFADRLPLAMQRSLSIVPGITVDPIAKWDAFATSDWRMRMWTTLISDVPKYFWIGKGYKIDATDLFLVEWKQHYGYAQDYEWAVVTGEYHNGPLSLIIPLGIVGTLAYIAFWYACLRYLWHQRKHGPPQFRTINTGLLALFVARILFFTGVHGGAAMDLVHLVGIIGLSVAINGAKRTVPATQPVAVAEGPDPLLTPAISR